MRAPDRSAPGRIGAWAALVSMPIETTSPWRLAWVRLARVKLVRMTQARSRIAPERSAPVKSASTSLAPNRLAPASRAPVKLNLLRSSFSRDLPAKSAGWSGVARARASRICSLVRSAPKAVAAKSRSKQPEIHVLRMFSPPDSLADISQMNGASAYLRDRIARPMAVEKRRGATWRSETAELRDRALRAAALNPFEPHFGRTSLGGPFGRRLRCRNQHRATGFGRRPSISPRMRRNRSLGAEVAAKMATPVARDNRLQRRSPVIGAMDVAPTQRGLFQITELVEHEQWMITGAAEAAIVGRALLHAMRRLSELSISSTIIFGALCSWTRSIQVPDKLSSLASHCVSKRAIWFVGAAMRSGPMRSTMARIAGSRDRRPASFTSS